MNKVTPVDILTLQDLLTSSGKYPERAKSPELTQQMLQDGQTLIDRVNRLILALRLENVKISSGFRPSTVNAALPNSAKRSLHMQCKAVDLVDPGNKIGKLILQTPDLLKQFNLWLEDPAATKNWCHLDSGERTARKIKVFKP